MGELEVRKYLALREIFLRTYIEAISAIEAAIAAVPSTEMMKP